MITEALHKVAHHRASLSRQEAHDVLAEILSGKASDAQIAALLVALHMKGETVEEIVGFAEAIRAAAPSFSATENSTLDVSGTSVKPWWTHAAPAATPATRSTSPPLPRLRLPGPAYVWPSTAIAESLQNAARRM